LPEIVSKPDKIVKTKLSKANKFPTIAYIKRVNGFFIVIEEVLVSKKRQTKRLPIITMYKQAIGKGRVPDELMQSIVASLTTPETPPVLSASSKVAKNIPIQSRIENLKTLLSLDKNDTKIKKRIQNLEIINAL
jgi:hypothetical protein